jgi:anti-sigma B factor antagonist
MLRAKVAQEYASEPTPRLRITAIELDTSVVLVCSGRLQFREEAAVFRVEAEQALARHKNLILDFTDLETIDCAGVGELVLAHTRARAADCGVVIASPARRVRHLLDLTKVALLLRISESRAAALASFRSPAGAELGGGERRSREGEAGFAFSPKKV